MSGLTALEAFLMRRAEDREVIRTRLGWQVRGSAAGVKDRKALTLLLELEWIEVGRDGCARVTRTGLHNKRRWALRVR